MKKLLLFFFFAIAASAIQAQNNNMYSLLYYGRPGFFYNVSGLMQQHDGDFILNAFVYEDAGNYMSIPVGNMFYKISPSTYTIIDSLLMADTTQVSCFITRNPRGEGNIRVLFDYQEVCDSTFLRIGHFPDNDLYTNSEEDIVVPLCEGNVYGGAFVDSKGDLILQYFKEIDDVYYDEYAARFDIEGSLKHQALVDENEMWGLGGGLLREFKESPLKYYQWGYAQSYNGPYRNMIVYVADSLFHRNTVIISSILSEEVIDPPFSAVECLDFNYETEIIPIGGDDILVASKYVSTTIPHLSQIDDEYGVAVAKYDIRTMQKKGYVVFNDYPGGDDNQAACMGLKMMTDGTVYFMYKEQGYPAQSVVIVKMDTDLNLEWKRVCKTEDINMRAPMWHSLLFLNENGQGEEQGIAWAGDGRKAGNNKDGMVCFFLNHDGTVDTNETGIVVRPYAFYPNPVKEQLRMEFSPDVQPAKVELYDLQGRLLRTQDKAFESIDMSRLPSGTYTMRVTLEDGKSYTDKVVKE